MHGGSDLERRAAQVRADDERARRLRIYENDVRRRRAKPPTQVGARLDRVLQTAPPRRFLGICLGCGREVWVHDAKPRKPFCPGGWCAEKYRAGRRRRGQRNQRQEWSYV